MQQQKKKKKKKSYEAEQRDVQYKVNLYTLAFHVSIFCTINLFFIALIVHMCAN
jgi:hypothetical protein